MSLKTSRSLFRTVTFRLTAWYTCLGTGLLLACVAVFGLLLARDLRNHTDRWLRNEAARVESAANKDPDRALWRLRNEFNDESELNGITRVFYALLSPQLEVLVASDLTPWRRIDVPALAATCLSSAGRCYETLPVPNAEHGVRVLAQRTADGQVIVVGITRKADEELLERYWRTAGLVLGLLLVSSSLTGWFIARRAMSGVKRVTAVVAAIGSAELGRRVPTLRDGEEVDNLAQAFNDMLARIQSLVTELREMSNNIAHDLRSPLTRIRLMAETTLTGKAEADRCRETLGLIVEESDRLVGMINTMLEIAAAEAGEAPPLSAPVDLAIMVGEAVELFRPVAEDKGVRLELAPSASPLVVMGDKIRLQRALANLLDNAIKYTAAGGCVRVETQNTADLVTVSVRDTGIGIAEGELARIFTRFYRGDRSRTAPGNGLGLSLARAIVRAHGGDISVASTVGRGSTFSLRLPRTVLAAAWVR